MGVLFLCNVEQEKRPKSFEAKLLGGGMMVSWIPPILMS